MKNIWLLHIESVETRYTGQWRRHLREQLEHAAADRDIAARVIDVDGDLPDQIPTKGAFLDFAATNIFKSTQVAELARRFRRGEVKPNDVLVFTDAWHPGVHQLRYMSALLPIPVCIVGLWHAGHYDPNDFLGRIGPQHVPWAKDMERALFKAYDVNAFATQAHIGLFCKGPGAAEDGGRVVKVGWPMEYLPRLLEPYKGMPKRNLVLFPHRVPAPEKQVEIFDDLAEAFPDWQFDACQRTPLSKDTYHRRLAEARVVFSCSLQETLGIGCYEGVLSGAVPVVPDRLSYTEMYPEEFRYPSEWTASWEDYLRHKPQLVDHLRGVLARAEAGVDLEPCRQQLTPFFSGEALYNEVFEKL
ncbi:hypothetical protein ACWFZ6_18565 [Methylorubrum extorquens]